MKSKVFFLFAAAILNLQAGNALAVGPQDAERLGKDLTPLGGEKAGNANGSIPAWVGTEPPLAGWSYGKKRADHWKHKDEKPLFSIDATTVDKYADKLSPGQVQLVKQLKGYRMDVYPSHRTCGVPSFVTENTKKNVTTASLAPEGWYLKEAVMPGTPFPFPSNGAEAMLNGKFNYRGVGAIYAPTITAISPRPGSHDWIMAKDDVTLYFPWGKKGSTLWSALPKVDYFLYFSYSAPPALAGQGAVISSFTDQPGNETYYYFPGQRRVRRMPSYSYDSPQIGYENQYTMDESLIFSGTLDRFDWKLIGKKEMYVQYNSFGPYNFDHKFEEFAQDQYVNPNSRRYELHRVWVVEATVKSGMRHTAPKRTFYLDEDSWALMAADDYDSQGKVMKVREGSLIPIYEIGACNAGAIVQHNLNDGRYVVDLNSAGTGADAKWLLEPSGPQFQQSYYTADNLRAISDR